ncbi:MAG TPA: cytochrome b/b6 domain-containing protein [Hyphomicrobiaceae bacterium]|nr:cytochrome b/b6 domain-containing protein [Hyphomicrobiaceae bacterium]
MQTSRSYSPLQRTLHWLIALGVIVMVPLGIYMVQRGAWSNFDALTNTLYSWHKLIGFCLLWVIVLRIIVRLARGAPPPEPIHPILQFGATLSHFGLYVLLLLVPVLGWVGLSAYGAMDAALGITLPSIVAKNDALSETVLQYHGWAALLLGLVALVHIGAALMHRFIFKDGVFARMWPGAGPGGQ